MNDQKLDDISSKLNIQLYLNIQERRECICSGEITGKKRGVDSEATSLNALRSANYIFIFKGSRKVHCSFS